MEEDRATQRLVNGLKGVWEENIQRKGGTKENGASILARLRSPTRMRDIVRRSGGGGRHDVVTTKSAHLHPLRGGVHIVLSAEANQLAGSIKEVGPVKIQIEGERREERLWGPQCHRGSQSQGQSQNGRGARVLNLHKQKTLDVLSSRTVLGVGTTTSKLVALCNPSPPVRRDLGHVGTRTGGRRRGETGGRRGGGRGSGQRRAFDPQNRGWARRPRPQGGHRDYCAIGWGWRNPRRRRSLPRSHIKSITCWLL